MKGETKGEIKKYLADCYTGFVCGVKPSWDYCNPCEHFTVRSGWGEYCKASEQFAELVTDGLIKKLGQPGEK